MKDSQPKMFNMLFLLVVSLVAMVTGDFTFTCTPPESKPGPAMPTLHDQYQMRVEANIVQSDRTVEVLESYDYTGGQVSLTMTRDSLTYRSIHDFNTGERYDIKPDQTCNTTQINSTSDTSNVFGFSVKGKDGKVHIASVNDIFKLGAKYNASYVGESEIRGIKVNQWTSCQANSHTVFKLDYFFSRLPYISADNETQVPIRFTITGQAVNHGRPGIHNYTHVYEFSFYKPGPIKDRTVFQTPPGVVCEGRKSSVPFPKVDDFYSLDIEMDIPGRPHPFTAKVYFDYDYKLIRMDRFYDADSKHKYGVGLISTIQDYNTGVEYIIDQDEGNCTVEQLDPKFGRGTPDHHPTNVTMSHAYELMSLKNRTFIYQGEREWRGMTVDAWANLTNHVVIEYYLLKAPAHVPGRPSQPSVVVGMFRKNITAANLEGQGHPAGQGQGPSQGQGQGAPQGQGQGAPQGQGQGPTQGQGQGPTQGQSGTHSQTIRAETFAHVFNFHSGHPDREVFDVGACYEKTANHSLYFTFTVTGSYSEHVYGHKSVFIPSVRSAMAGISGVSPTRITDIQVNKDKDDATKLVITFKLLDKVPIKGDVANPPKQLSLYEAEMNIKKAAMFGVRFVVKYPKRPVKIFVAHTYSMQKVVAPKTTDIGPVFSSGSLAGMGIGMLLFGCIIGLLVAFVIHKRISTDVPYQRETS